MTKAKQKGSCPFCENVVAAEIVKELFLRRDKCKCPECDETIYKCRSPSCHDYAKGTAVYDHELCPRCTAAVTNIVGGGIRAVGGAVLTVVTGVIATTLAKKHKD